MVARLALALWLVTACHPAPAPPRASAAPPSAAALFVHDDEGYRLHIADFAGGGLTPVGPARELAHQPVWSPDGTQLAYRVGEQVFVHRDGVGRDVAVADSVDLEAARPYAFSPDGRRLAIARRGEVTVAMLASKSASRLASYPGRRVGDLRWSPDGATLVALIRGTEPADAAQLAWIPALGGTAQLRDARGTIRLLGWRAGALLTVEAHDGRERVTSVPGPSGAPSPIALSESDDLAVVDYAMGPDRVILALGGDPDDDSALRLAAPGGASSPWLTGFPRLGPIELNAGGTWAVFVDRASGGDRPGGSVFVVRVGSNDARRVLPASAARSFSAPVPRPAS